MSSQSFDDVSADTPEFDTVAQALGTHRRELLLTLVETDRSHLNTAQLRDRTSVPRGSILHHLERLEAWGLIAELDQREYHGQSGKNARTWQLTEEGQRFCANDEYMDAPDSAFVSPDKVARLEREIGELREQAAERNEKLERLDRMLKWIVTESDIFDDNEKATILNGESKQ